MFRNKIKTANNKLLTFKVECKTIDSDKVYEIEKALFNNDKKFKEASQEFQFAAAVAEFALILQDSKYAKKTSYRRVLKTAKRNLGEDKNGKRAEFIELVKRAKKLDK